MLGETLGSYRIVSEIGTGGMGVVYLAEHTLLGRRAALKVLRPELAGDHVERFFNEARAAAMLHHPGLVDVFDFGHHTNGAPYIVMEFLPGESLAERLEHEPRLPLPTGCMIARSVANALHAAHEQGIIHRDLKPGNIFLVPDPESASGTRVKVLDFGIAKLVRDRAPSVHTHTGAMIGTPRYMSPEQCKSARTVDGRSDVYSLGCILYEMLLGVPPFDYESWAELVGAHLHEQPPRPSELDAAIPAAIEDVILMSIAKRPEDRYQSMVELAHALEDVLHGISADLPIRFTPPVGRPAVKLSDKHPTPRDTAASAPTMQVNDIANQPHPSQLGRPARPATDPTLNANRELAAPRTSSSARYVAIGGVAVGVLGAGIVAFVMSNRSSKPVEQTFIVVDQRGSSSDRVGTDGPPIDAAEVGIAVVADAASDEAPLPDAGARTVPRPPKPPTQPDEAQLTRAFGKQNAAINRCFVEHSGAPADGLAVRFEINAQGRVASATVLPESAGATALGTCIAAVARSTEFGPQPMPLNFRVPIVPRSGR